MRKATGLLFVLSGAVLIILALLLFGFNRQEAISAGEAADKVLEELLAGIEKNDAGAADSSSDSSVPDESDPVESDTDDTDTDEEDSDTDEQETESSDDDSDETEEYTDTESEDTDSEEYVEYVEPTVTIDGHDYIGYVSVPSVDIILPVMADWDYWKLQTAPCRQFGTAAGGDLVIAGHDYSTHFASLANVKVDAEVEFTDVNGHVYKYTVSRIEILDSDEVDYVQNNDSEMVLYTCTYTGVSRIAVFCDLTE